MANHQDAIKRNSQNIRRRAANRHYRSMMRNQIKKLNTAIDGGDQDAANAELRSAIAIIQRVAGKRIIHRNQAARRCARLNAAVKAMG